MCVPGMVQLRLSADGRAPPTPRPQQAADRCPIREPSLDHWCYRFPEGIFRSLLPFGEAVFAQSKKANRNQKNARSPRLHSEPNIALLTIGLWDWCGGWYRSFHEFIDHHHGVLQG